MENRDTCRRSNCPLGCSRRSFLAAAGVTGASTQMGLLSFASSLFAAEGRPGPKPLIRAVFVRPDTDKYWLGWPGAAYNIKEHQQTYTKILKDAAAKYNVDLVLVEAPLNDEAAVTRCLDTLKRVPPQGLIVVSMSLNQSWPHINRLAKERGDIPTIVFSPMGTSFTGHLQGTRNIPGVYVAATQDLDWLDLGMRMLRTTWDMKLSRICVCRGDKVEDRKLDAIGTTLHYIPRQRYADLYNGMEETQEMRELADFYTKSAKKIVEPKRQDILNSVKNYVLARRLMRDEKCDGISVDCLPLVESHQLAAPPCMAWLRLNDEGSVGACEADWSAAISLRLNSLLFGRPGFMQDPCPNTVNNTLMGAHCSCPTKLDGFDKPAAPLILRSHSESNLGVSPQVLWREGQPVTIMKFQGEAADTIILGTGKVVSNIETPPAGGCRTSVEITLDGVEDTRDAKGFHQLFIYGDLEAPFKAYSQLAGLKVVHV